MRHESTVNAERNRDLVECRKAHPDWSWQEIADEFHITRQCAHAIYKRATGDYGYGWRRATIGRQGEKAA